MPPALGLQAVRYRMSKKTQGQGGLELLYKRTRFQLVVEVEGVTSVSWTIEKVVCCWTGAQETRLL